MKALRCGIYFIENKINGKLYLGSSKALHRRWQEHCGVLNRQGNTNSYLQRAWNLHGQAAFRYGILEYCDEIDLLARERWWIELLNTRHDGCGYNLTGAWRGTWSPEVRQRMSEAAKRPRPWMKGRKASEETRAKMSAARKGKPPPRAAVEAAILALKGKPKPREQVEKTAAANRGRKATSAARANMSAAHKGWVPPPRWIEAHKVARAKQVAPFTGKQHSEETKQRMAEARRQWHQRRLLFAAHD